MNAVQFLPLIIATLSLIYASFMGKRNWATVAFVVWLVIFVLTFFIFK